MAKKLNDYFVPKPAATSSPSTTQWVTINPAGGGDYLTLNEAWNAGQKNMFFVEGTHYMTADIFIDTSTAAGKEPLRLHGENRETTFIQVNNGETMYIFDIQTTDGWLSDYDYTQDPPVYADPTKTITFLKGTNRIIANNFVWSDWDQLTSTAPVIGDFIEVGYSDIWYKIIDIQTDTVLVVSEYNNTEDYVDVTGFSKVNEIPIELVNITIGIGDNPVTVNNPTYNTDTLFYNRYMNYRPKTGIKFYIKDVFSKLCFNNKTEHATMVYTGGGTPSFVQNIRLPGGCGLDLGGRSTVIDSQFYGDITPTTGSTFINCISKDGFFISPFCTMIGCTILNTTWDTPQKGVRIIGCSDVDGNYDDIVPNKGVETAAFNVYGQATTGIWYSWISGFGDNTYYESDYDSITSIQEFNGGNAVAQLRDPSFLDFSLAKRYNGIFTQDGVTNDALLNLGEPSPLHTAGLNLYMILYQGTQYFDDFAIEYVDSGTIKLTGAWSVIQPLLTREGKLNNFNQGTQHYLYFPYIRVTAGATSTSGRQWVVQTQRYKQNYSRLHYWD